MLQGLALDVDYVSRQSAWLDARSWCSPSCGPQRGNPLTRDNRGDTAEPDHPAVEALQARPAQPRTR